jgi:hypothetical protein
MTVEVRHDPDPELMLRIGPNPRQPSLVDVEVFDDVTQARLWSPGFGVNTTEQAIAALTQMPTMYRDRFLGQRDVPRARFAIKPDLPDAAAIVAGLREAGYDAMLLVTAEQCVEMDPFEPLDPGIAETVRMLRRNGVRTFASCQGGGEPHCHWMPWVRFFGDEAEALRVVSLCRGHGLPIGSLDREYYIRAAPPRGLEQIEPQFWTAYFGNEAADWPDGWRNEEAVADAGGYTIEWARATEPDTTLTCTRLSPRVALARLMQAIRNTGPVIVRAVHPPQRHAESE